jgi:D-alanyl-D-alanine dipeptidase
MSSNGDLPRKQSFPARWLALLALAGAAHGAELADAIPRASRQLIVVTTESWTASHAVLQRYERAGASEPWSRVGKAMPALTGERGLAWGLGLHAIPPDATRRKREGDRCAPAGVFRVTGAFGQLAPGELGALRLPYRRVTADSLAVDDPASRYYNRRVERSRIPRPDWRSAERLDGGPHYRLAIDLTHNPRHVPGAGSCIFLHEWTTHRTGTAGCTVLRAADLRALVEWLDADAQPVLVQVPQTAAPRL